MSRPEVIAWLQHLCESNHTWTEDESYVFSLSIVPSGGIAKIDCRSMLHISYVTKQGATPGEEVYFYDEVEYENIQLDGENLIVLTPKILVGNLSSV